ncbi:MAG TPA: shikimate kinase [Pyrinomonadaceae bacterium]|nr:shikimate kinase [Pyrinomonadaceae bacterium]
MKDVRIALTGFMGVGKSSVARHLSNLLEVENVDLDSFIEESESRDVAQIIDDQGIDAYRDIETRCLERLLSESPARIFSLGGGTFTVPRNRELIRENGIVTVWLESTFAHCWYNIKSSKKERPLARDKRAAKKLFDSRQSVYSLADWHFIIKPEFTSYDIATQIAEQVFA